MKFNYKARTKDGKPETGIIEASSPEIAAAILQKYNIFVTSLTQENTGQFFLKNIKFERNV